MNNRLKALKQERRLKISEICEAVGISSRSYCKYQSGEWSIPSDTLCRFAEYFECSTDYILGIKNYTTITVTDNDGAVLASISQNEVIEHDSVKVVLS